MSRGTGEGKIDRHGCCVPMTASFLWARLSLVEDEKRAAKSSGVLSSCSGPSFTGDRHRP